jgi:hypothetical protein
VNLRNPKKEANLSTEISFVILEICIDFIKDFAVEMSKKASTYFTKIFGVLTRLIQHNQSKTFLSAIFTHIAYLVVDFKK